MKTHYVKLNTLFANAFTLYKVKNDRQPLCVRQTKNPHTFKIFCETNEHTWISSSSFNYKRAMELAEKFYDKMNKNELYQI